ncbi:MAG: ATP-binding protein, partial [Luteolibacter sp.]
MPATPARLRHLSVILWIAGFCASALSAEPTKPSLTQLETRLEAIDAELGTLARTSLRSGVGPIGYRSDWTSETLAHPEPGSVWVEVDLGARQAIDQVVLIPCIYRDSENGFQSDGFPPAFEIWAGGPEDKQGQRIAVITEQDPVLPRIAPLIIEPPETAASWLRIVPTRLSQRAFDQFYAFQLSEMMVFSGETNIALRRPVSTADPEREFPHAAWDKRYLVDGFTPYLMHSAHDTRSVAYISKTRRSNSLILDLESAHTLSRIHLHVAEQDDTVPQAYVGDLGIPPHLVIEGANREDFSDAVTLLDHIKQPDHADTGPILMWDLPLTRCRFIKISGTSTPEMERFRIGFAEIELFENGKNVALGKSIDEDVPKYPKRSLETMTDGKNLYGKILPIREWIQQLARRHDLESERPVVAAALQQLYSLQERRIRLLTIAVTTLALGIALFIIVQRYFHRRELERLRTRFSADLHDELGANLHVIGMLGDLARNEGNPSPALRSIHEKIRAMTERTSKAVRYCTNMIEAKGLYEDLLADMQRFTERILADIDYTFTYRGEEHLATL